MYSTVPLESVATHRDVSEIRVGSLEEISAPPNVGVSKFSAPVATGEALRVMVVNKASEVLVVALHGATNRAKKELPRFEWFRTLRGEAVSSMYVSDPLLEADPTLELAWYVGRFSYDLHASLAGLIERTAKSVGARRVVILGSSGGGGFAALQIATFIKGSLALPFNPQTALARYRVGGSGLGAQRKFLSIVMPELAPDVSLEKLPDGVDWSAPLSGRLSAVRRYSDPCANFVYFVQNVNDVPHLEGHCEPFRSVIGGGANESRVRFDLYEGPVGHNPPSTAEFYRTLRAALEWHVLVFGE